MMPFVRDEPQKHGQGQCRHPQSEVVRVAEQQLKRLPRVGEAFFAIQ